MFLDDENDFRIALDIIDGFTCILGLRINKHKSEAMWLGCKINSTYNPQPFNMKNKTKILVVYFSNSICESKLEENWTERIDNCKRLIAIWEKRNVSIMSKVLIIKSFLISQWVYLMQAIFVPNHIVIELNRMLYRCLWRKTDCNKKAFEKVKRNVLCSEREKGGIEMIDLKDFQTACLLQWAVKLNDNNVTTTNCSKWWDVASNIFDRFGEKCICFYATVKSANCKWIYLIQSYFWRSVLCAWLDNNSFKDAPVSNIIWNNRAIKYQ